MVSRACHLEEGSLNMVEESAGVGRWKREGEGMATWRLFSKVKDNEVNF